LIEEFLRRHVRPKSRTAAETERMLVKDVAGPWRDRKVQDITRRDVVRLLDGIVDRGAPHVANRLFDIIRKMFGWSAERGIIEVSPCVGLKAPAGKTSRDRILSDDEVRWFWAATERFDYPFQPFFRLLLLTGQRRDEIAGMRRSELDLAAAMWTLPRERSKNDKAHEIPLSTAALEALTTVPTIASQALLFSTNGRSSISGYSKAKARLDRLMLEAARDENPDAVIQPWRIHDLRRSAASGMARLGQPVHVVEAVLNHRSGTIRGVAAVYNRYSYADEKRRALEAWGRFLSDLVNNEPAANVVALRA
jgi:integrase